VTSLSRYLRVGPTLLRLKQAYNYGLKVEVSTFLAKHRYLRDVGSLLPMNSGTGAADCFMLLNQARFWEGVWSLYSFRIKFGPCRIIVLSDGTLRRESVEILEKLFPEITIPEFETNNEAMTRYLTQQGLSRCREWRKRFIFFRKLVDPLWLAQSNNVILLDSDCLHFEVPLEIKAWAEEPTKIRYIADLNRHSLCAPVSELADICGSALPEYFCAGYLCFPKSAINIGRIERYLAADCFDRQLVQGRFAHVAEQSLYAMEAAVAGAVILPPEYATCPDVQTRSVTMGHFCGGSYQRTWFYTKALPLISSQSRIGPY
jgi:hypothetical protein